MTDPGSDDVRTDDVTIEDVPIDEEDLEVLDEVEWLTDADGTEYFVHEGTRYELGEDGYAYEVGPATPVSPTVPSAGDRPDPTTASREAAPTEVIPTVTTAVPPVTRAADRPAPEPAASRVTPPDTLLELSGLRSGYGSLPVLHGVDIQVAVGQTAVLFGLNGAGKTTTAMNVCGALKPWDGTITFDGQDVTTWNTKRRVDAGIVMVPEGRRVFPELSVARNLQVGAWNQRNDDEWVAHQREQVLDYFPRLRERLSQLAGTLSGGEQQMLAMARGLMARPKLLIIDEASMGLAPVIVKDVFDIVRQINQDGVTVLMIEQNVGALEVADLGVVMEQGRIIRTLRGDELTDRSIVSEALMG
jgi:branched-chain amino acid transport system ATP-binding protein